MITLRKKIDDAKAEYQARYGALDSKFFGENGWRLVDEGIPWAIQDYHGSVGSVMDFTEDDWHVCKENNWTLDEICILCCEPWFTEDTASISSYLDMILTDKRQTAETYFAKDEEISKQVILDAVENFYTWRHNLLPVAEKVYNKG